MRTRHLGLLPVLVMLFAPAPAQAQGDFIKSNVKHFIEKAGVYVSASSRTTIDEDVKMGRSLGIGFGMAGTQRTGKKFPFSYSAYRADLQTNGGQDFGQIKAHQIMSGVGYQWAHGKMVYGVQVGLGYSFNSAVVFDNAPAVFSTAPPVAIDVGNSWVVRPQAKVEYYLYRKVSLRTQLSYTYTDPHVVVTTVQDQFVDAWRPNHWQLSFAVGLFPFRK